MKRNSINKKCEICNVEFPTTSPRQKYCPEHKGFTRCVNCNQWFCTLNERGTLCRSKGSMYYCDNCLPLYQKLVRRKKNKLAQKFPRDKIPTIERAAIIEMMNNGLTYERMAVRTNIKKSRIIYLAKILNAVKDRKVFPKQERIKIHNSKYNTEEIIGSTMEGFSASEVASKLKIPRAVVFETLKRSGLDNLTYLDYRKKQCAVCGETQKDLFYVDSDDICLNCSRVVFTKGRAMHYLGGKCVRCGYHGAIGAMQFHHKDKDNKYFTISDFLGRRSKLSESAFEKLKIELDKCELICCRCHCEEHVSGPNQNIDKIMEYWDGRLPK